MPDPPDSPFSVGLSLTLGVSRGRRECQVSLTVAAGGFSASIFSVRSLRRAGGGGVLLVQPIVVVEADRRLIWLSYLQCMHGTS